MRPAFFLLLLALLTITACNQKKTAAGGGGMADFMNRVQPVEVSAIQTMDLEETLGLVGTIAANESAELRPEVSGTLTEILFEEGSALAKNAPLARLDTRELEAQLAETQARFVLAERNLTRNQELHRSEAVSRLELDQTQAEFDQLRASLRLLEVRLAKSVITAPFAGTASARSHSVGDFVTPESVLTTLDDLSQLKVDMEVPERYLPNLQPGTRFTLTTATSPQEATIVGEVYFVSSRIDSATRATLVKGYVKDAPPFIKPGMFANVKLILRTEKAALVVPETALLNSPMGTVLIKPEGPAGAEVAAFVPVKTGIRVPGFVQVSAVGPPIQAGEKIVSAGVGGLILFPGMKLKPVEPLLKPGPPTTNSDRKF